MLVERVTYAMGWHEVVALPLLNRFAPRYSLVSFDERVINTSFGSVLLMSQCSLFILS